MSDNEKQHGNNRTTNLLRCNGPLARLPQLLNDPLVPSQILLAADENDREPSAEMHDFRDPLQTGVNHPFYSTRQQRTFS